MLTFLVHLDCQGYIVRIISNMYGDMPSRTSVSTFFAWLKHRSTTSLVPSTHSTSMYMDFSTSKPSASLLCFTAELIPSDAFFLLFRLFVLGVSLAPSSSSFSSSEDSLATLAARDLAFCWFWAAWGLAARASLAARVSLENHHSGIRVCELRSRSQET
jgi:hypothetical protein